MSKRATKLLLEDIIFAIEKLLKHTQGLSRETLLHDDWAMDAILRNFEIIGEAANQLEKEFLEKHPNIPWRNIINMRHRIIHDYAGVNYDLVLDTIEDYLPALLTQLKAIVDAIG